MKRIDIEESKGRTITEVLGSEHRDLLVIFKGNEFALINDSGYFVMNNFKESDMLRLGFITPDEPDAQERQATLSREGREIAESARHVKQSHHLAYTHEFNVEPCPPGCPHAESVQDAMLCRGQCQHNTIEQPPR